MLALKPLNDIEPWLPPQVDGFVLVLKVKVGLGLTVTTTVAAGEVQLLTVCVTLYVPAMVKVTGVRVTGDPVAVPPPLGKVQLKLLPVADKVNVPPSQTGFGVAVTAVGAAGLAGSLKVTGPASTFEVQPLSVTEILV